MHGCYRRRGSVGREEYGEGKTSGLSIQLPEPCADPVVVPVPVFRIQVTENEEQQGDKLYILPDLRDLSDP